jgi:hypothetical protein
LVLIDFLFPVILSDLNQHIITRYAVYNLD